MNKQKLIDKLKKRLTTKSEIDGSRFDKGYEYATKCDLALIAELDEPEKPVVPQYVADWIEWCKRNKVSLLGGFSAIDELGSAICNDKKVKSLEASKWAAQNQETFAKAWLYGYEVEKEKLYTAKLKLTNEYLVYYASIKDLHHTKTTDNVAKKEKVFHFTEDDLVKYHIWGNDAYEIREVEDE